MRSLLLLLIIIPVAAFPKTGGPENSYYVLEDFQNKWLYYDEAQKQMLPFTAELDNTTPAHSVLLNTRLFKDFVLLAKSDDTDGQLFVNNSIYISLPKNEWVIIPVADFKDRKEILLTLYGSSFLGKKSLLIGSKVPTNQTKSSLSKDRLAIIKLRPPRQVENTFVVVFMLVLSFATVLTSTNPKAFSEYIEVSDLFTTKIRESKFLISKPLNRVNIAFIGLLSLLSGYLYLLMAGEGVVLFSDHIPFNLQDNTGGYFLLFVLASTIAFLVYLLKFFLLSICGKLFGLGKTVNIHFYKNIQFLLLSFLLLAFLLHLFSVQHRFSREGIADWLPIILIIIYSGRTLLAFFSILKNHNIQYLFLIAYLCVVEVLPTIIGFRLAF